MAPIGDAIADALLAAGIDTVFGIPRTQSLTLNEAIAKRDDIRFVMARHEAAVTHQAWGYAETGGGLAATVVIPGPGDMNAMNGLKNALNDCTPLVHIAIETEPGIRGGDGIHETPPETYDTVVKENHTVKTAESAVAALKRLIAVSQTPPGGPVRIGIPKDVLAADVPVTETGTYPIGEPPTLPGAAIDRAASRLAEADSPVIIAGGGVRKAGAQSVLETVASRLDAPVVPTYKGKGVFPEDHALFAGILSVGTSANLEALLAGSDAALAIGTDLDAVTTQAWSFDLPAALVHITLDADDIAFGYPTAIGIAADAEAALSALADRLPGPPSDPTGPHRAARVRSADASLMAELLESDSPPLPSVRAERAIDAALPDDAIVAVDAGGFRIWSLYGMTMTADREFVDSGSWATMGCGLPAAIGACLANPGRPVLGLMGGGGLLMAVEELHTLAAESIPVLVAVLNNNDYATISAEAAASFSLESGEYAWQETPIQFADIAEAMGVPARRPETPGEIRAAVTAYTDDPRPMLLEIQTDPDEPQAKPLD